MKTGNLHSIETMGMVDGPGIRTIFFLQGCPLRCGYCHNPDSQHFMGTKHISVSDVLETARRYKSYYDATGGGVTFSGGEPLMQGEFLVDALKALKAEGISTCLDTSGYGIKRYYKEILRNTDVVLLDIKAMTDQAHLSLTGRDRDGSRQFIEALIQHFDGKIIIRHVMVPGLTDQFEKMDDLLDVIAPIKNQVEKIEILPYHKDGAEKYSQLNLPYTFEVVPAMDPERARVFEAYVNEKHMQSLSVKTLKGASNH